MWLIDTDTLQLEKFHQCPAKTYAILSHTWRTAAEEPTFEEFRNGKGREKAGFEKIRLCCRQASSDGLQYAWVDTVCIDKRSSTELSEAINSMFMWYQQSKICYAYLADISDNDPLDPLTSTTHAEILQGSQWFQRGWTLQELIAPDALTFFSKEWVELGTKSLLAKDLQLVTTIDIDVLKLSKSFLDCSIAQRMSWASKRQTTRLEDVAYCLIGLFNVNLPMMYGEGSKAFLRLQQAIIIQTDDETIFAWSDVPEDGSSLLAPCPASFAQTGHVQQGGGNRERPYYFNTNKGLSIECELIPCEMMNTYKVPLRCFQMYGDSERAQVAIFISRTVNDDQYRRVSYHGRGIDRVTEKELSHAKVRSIFVPFVQHGLELAPREGSPLLHFQSEHQVWFIEQVESNYIWHDLGTDELYLPRKIARCQFQKRDLEIGILLAIQQNAHPKAPFTIYLQLGFDFDFNPVAILHHPNFYIRPPGPGSRPMYLGKRICKMIGTYTLPCARWTGTILQRFPKISWKVGCRSKGLTLGPAHLSQGLACRSEVQVSMKPLHGVQWIVEVERQPVHSNTRLSNECVCAICILECIGRGMAIIVMITLATLVISVVIFPWVSMIAIPLTMLLGDSYQEKFIYTAILLLLHIFSVVGVVYLYLTTGRNFKTFR